ncbi:MAG: preprotein translocase subunit YajC [Vicinamibacteria bacterium]|nr:preprotein translocase subunit YajC [Vicinamibacteria bacterium]
MASSFVQSSRWLLALAGNPQQGEASPWMVFLPWVLILGFFYFILILPTKQKQKKHEALLQSLKVGDKIIVNPGIFAVVVGVESDFLLVRIDEKARLKILKSAVMGLEEQKSGQQ